MLTRADKTVEDCLDVVEVAIECGVSHIGFKDIGVDAQTLRAVVGRIKAAGGIAYMEVVSTTAESVRTSIETALDIGVDRVLGGQDLAFALEVLGPSGIAYYPFPGRPVGHPTELRGTPDEVAADSARMRAAGCAGVDLLAYRATDADPLDLVRAARDGLDGGTLIVAGSIDSPARIRDLAAAGADAFTIGTAAFDDVFAPDRPGLEHQCRAILAASQAVTAHA